MRKLKSYLEEHDIEYVEQDKTLFFTVRKFVLEVQKVKEGLLVRSRGENKIWSEKELEQIMDLVINKEKRKKGNPFVNIKLK